MTRFLFSYAEDYAQNGRKRYAPDPSRPSDVCQMSQQAITHGSIMQLIEMVGLVKRNTSARNCIFSLRQFLYRSITENAILEGLKYNDRGYLEKLHQNLLD